MGGADLAARCAGIQGAAAGQGDLDAAIDDLLSLPEFPGRGSLAALLLQAILVTGPSTGTFRLGRLAPLLALADADPPPDPGWPCLRAAARAGELSRAAAEREIFDPKAAMAELDRLETDAAGHPAAMMHVRFARAGIAMLLSVYHGDVALPASFTADKQFMRAMTQGHPMGAAFDEMLDAATAVLDARQLDGDVFAAMERMAGLAERFPEGSDLRTSVERAAAVMAPLRAVMEGTGRVTDEQLATMRKLATGGGLSAADAALAEAFVGGAAIGGGTETDPARIAQGIEHSRTAVARTPPGHPQRAAVLLGLALGLVRRNELTNSLADIDEAITVLEEALRSAGGPMHPQWSGINEMLAHAQRRRGVADPHLRALDGLRANTWRVLLQPTPAAAHVAARSAARDALDVARLCLADNHPGDAIRALDLGRGLALYAATERQDVPARLIGSGRAGLAERWRTADADHLPEEVRREILGVLTADGASAQLLEAPSIDDIREALATLDADALVYLMPADPPQPGFAIIVPVAGRVAYCALPNLSITEEMAVEQFFAAISVRDFEPAAAPPGASLADSVAKICGWAWHAAIGPLYERYLAGIHPDGDRPPRVVLVPTGELARIPWQAAQRPDGTYAVQLLALSQAVSARLLCRTARLAPVPPSPVGLVVGDPDPGVKGLDLPAARIEAFAIHRDFYWGGRYLGRRPDSRPGPAGTAEEVRAWIRGTGPAAGTTLHLACHGFVGADPRSATSYLLLAGGERLAADELVELLAAVPERAIGLVVLAACRTGQAMSGYDEAYSLGTAFLAGGVRSVLSTQWSIPDAATSALMFMFHHYLMTERCPARDALRQAQLWMLDPRRRIPDRMPEQLREQLITSELGDVIAWAGFVHWGQ
ncbi:CHAT domain-containing protein [Dactylosporangium sp. NPDC005555]|uniref:CHAT domain-containing protein n=1 Tax=Dactylosporangium sp. NPDC005555 TaxID=3154889 RepID=UPI0033A05463